MKRQGFTLIELLAVIVILAIIALIATPVILDVVENARKGAAKSSALGYIDAVEKQIAINMLDSSKEDILDGVYEIADLDSKNVKVKGEKPSEGWVQIEKGQVSNYSLKVNNYYTNPTDGNVGKVSVSKTGEIATKPEGASSIPTMAEMCPGCVYAFPTSAWTYRSTLTPDQYKADYNDVVSESGKNYFIGLKLNTSGTIEKFYACGVENGTPFCLDGSTYATNVDILNQIYPSCNASASDSPARCEGSSVSALANINGNMQVYFGSGLCQVFKSGTVLCG